MKVAKKVSVPNDKACVITYKDKPKGRRRRRSKKHKIQRLAIALFLCLGTWYGSKDTTERAENTCPRRQAGHYWLSDRTTRFSWRWGSTRARNVALYSCIASADLPVLDWLVYHIFTCPDTLYDPLFRKLFSVPYPCWTHSCLKSYGRSQYIYAEFVIRTYNTVTSYVISPEQPEPDGKVAVLVEPRAHPLLEYTVKQVMSVLGPSWGLQIFVSNHNEAYVRKMFKAQVGLQGANIIITPISIFGLDNLGLHGNRIQSALSAHAELYDVIVAEHILWFQVDVIMRHEPAHDMLEFAYLGAEWRGCEFPTCSSDQCPAICGGGNSGLSLRRRSVMKAIGTKGRLPEQIWGIKSQHSSPDEAYFADDELHDNSLDRWFEDDLQISYKLSQLNMLPRGIIQTRFAVADAIPHTGICEVDPVGLHKPWMVPWFHPSAVAQLLNAPFKRLSVTHEWASASVNSTSLKHLQYSAWM